MRFSISKQGYIVTAWSIVADGKLCYNNVRKFADEKDAKTFAKIILPSCDPNTIKDMIKNYSPDELFSISVKDGGKITYRKSVLMKVAENGKLYMAKTQDYLQFKTYTKMEIQKNESLTGKQQFRYELLQWCGNVADAERATAFVMGDNEKPEQAQLPKSVIEDGVYLVHANGKFTLFEQEYTKQDNMDAEVVAIGLKMGEFSIEIALHDEADGRRIPLTTKDNGNDEKDKPYYIENYDDAVADMDGADNTAHLRNVLNNILNLTIKLDEEWYIPSLGEMYRIFINKKAINEALDYVKGDRLQDGWYWTSTELSATAAWYLYLSDGSTSNWGTKASDTGRVRAVSAFIL